MWMKMGFARWEVEGRAEERINNALREAEHARLVRTARGTKTRSTLGDVVNCARAILRAASLRAGRVQLQERVT